MKEKMPEISFERSMNHNYIILSQCSYFGKEARESVDYRTKMLLENRIPGLLPVTHRRMNGECRYYYEINSLQPLDRVYDKCEIQYEALRRLLSGCVSLFDRLEEYLLDGAQIIMKPELIYMDVENMEPYFVCYPEYEGDVRLSFMEFIDELLTKIDHTDERAVMLGYQVYRYTRNPNYVISEIGAMMGHMIVDLVHKERESAQMDAHLAGKFKSGGWNFSNHGTVNHSEKENSARQSDFTVNSYDACDSNAFFHTPKDQISDEKAQSGTKNIGDLIGGIFCVCVSLCAGAIIVGARILHSFELSGNNELYLCGAVAMAIVAAILFFSCYIKKRRQGQEIEDSGEDVEGGDFQYYTAVGSGEDTYDWNDKYSEPAAGLWHERDACDTTLERIDGGMCGVKSRERERENRPESCEIETLRAKSTGNRLSSCQQSETVYLGEGVVEERMLCGRMNGREVSISLDRLPMTVGKLADVADFVIHDTAVSKMHARFEEHDGRVYLCDLNSTNGTVRNGVLLDVNQSVALEPGDRLRFGRTCFTYC